MSYLSGYSANKRLIKKHIVVPAWIARVTI